MIGQKTLLAKLDKIKDNFPKFSILVGPKNSGKKTICKEISKNLGTKLLLTGIKIEDVRQAIDTARTQVEPLLFVVSDADTMSINAKNSLLKITEEPPKNCYFIMTLQDINNTLTTLQSRGTIFTLDNYTVDELLQYRQYKGYSNIFDEVLKLVCLNTGQVDELYSYDVADFYKFIKIVVDNIQVPKSGNAFKISQRLKIKETDNGFDVLMFLKAVEELFLKKGIDTKNKCYLQASIITAQYIRKLRSISISKQGIIDMWIIDVRAALRDL